MKNELKMWLLALIKNIPGLIGVHIRNTLIPYKHGKCCRIWDGVSVEEYRNLCMGDFVSINRGCVLHAGGGITIGSNVLIGPRTIIYSQNHVYDNKGVPIIIQGYRKKPVYIEDDVWVAAGCTVLPGCRIKKGSVIGAGAVVTKDTIPYGVYVGNPAKLIRMRK